MCTPQAVAKRLFLGRNLYGNSYPLALTLVRPMTTPLLFKIRTTSYIVK